MQTPLPKYVLTSTPQISMLESAAMPQGPAWATFWPVEGRNYSFDHGKCSLS